MDRQCPDGRADATKNTNDKKTSDADQRTDLHTSYSELEIAVVEEQSQQDDSINLLVEKQSGINFRNPTNYQFRQIF